MFRNAIWTMSLWSDFEKANEIYFRLGIIYKHQRKYQSSLEVGYKVWIAINAHLQCFKYILQDPPRPLTSWDIWFQLGHVYEQDRDVSFSDSERDPMLMYSTRTPETRTTESSLINLTTQRFSNNLVGCTTNLVLRSWTRTKLFHI